MREVQALVLVAFIVGVAIVIVCLLQAKCVVDVSRNVQTRDELQLAVDRRAHMVGRSLLTAGLGPEESLSQKVASSPEVAQVVANVAGLPVLAGGLRGHEEDHGHMLLVDATNGECVANAPARRMSPAALRDVPVNLNDMHTTPFRQQIIPGEAGTQGKKETLMPRVRSKVAGGGGHVTFNAAGATGKRRWHTYYAAVPGTSVYLGASAPVG
jgi:hypothetical protein